VESWYGKFPVTRRQEFFLDFLNREQLFGCARVFHTMNLTSPKLPSYSGQITARRSPVNPKLEDGLLSLSQPSVIRVLIVEDFQPFREYVCSALAKRPDLQVIAEVSDGLEAVQKAVELKPDLILLDIGLPTMNGIEAARRIRALVPNAKIIFLSQETSADVVEEALNTGARAYVQKAKAGRQLLAAIDAAILGQPFDPNSTH
jgi:CheY-like chemotaxis protein